MERSVEHILLLEKIVADNSNRYEGCYPPLADDTTGFAQNVAQKFTHSGCVRICTRIIITTNLRTFAPFEEELASFPFPPPLLVLPLPGGVDDIHLLLTAQLLLQRSNVGERNFDARDGRIKELMGFLLVPTLNFLQNLDGAPP